MFAVMDGDLVVFIQHTHFNLYHPFLGQARRVCARFAHPVMHIVFINYRRKSRCMVMTVVVFMIM